MGFETIIIEKNDNHVATLTLNRPESMNTFSSQMAMELNQGLIELDEDQSVRVILLKGAGRAFSAGIDVTELEGKTGLEYQQWIEKMERPLVSISKLNTPVIAQLHGVAAANGMGLIAAADLVIAADNARMGLTAINVGLNCVGPVIPVARCVGRKKA
ncbi:MAG: enoyl-CoA hydratase/isomerase family protein, partial [Desulfobacula sp.]|nr:enoyl-CoA hydratase/isomerase family protein [Desulfobacula sp.]